MSSKMKAVQAYCEAVIGDAAHLAGVLEPWEVLAHFEAIPEEIESPFKFDMKIKTATLSGMIYFEDNGICAAEIGVVDRARKQKWLLSFDRHRHAQPHDRPKKLFELDN